MKQRKNKLFGKRFKLHVENCPKPFLLSELIEHMNDMAYVLDGEPAIVRVLLTNAAGTKQVDAPLMSYIANFSVPGGKPCLTLIAEIENIEEKIVEATSHD